MSQAQLTETLGIPQRTPSCYEREAGDIPAGLAPPMAWALGVSVDELLGETGKKRRAGAGPTGRMRRLFEAASKLPRSQQEKIAAILETFVNQYSDREAEMGMQPAIIFFQPLSFLSRQDQLTENTGISIARYERGATMRMIQFGN